MCSANTQLFADRVYIYSAYTQLFAEPRHGMLPAWEEQRCIGVAGLNTSSTYPIEIPSATSGKDSRKAFTTARL